MLPLMAFAALFLYLTGVFVLFTPLPFLVVGTRKGLGFGFLALALCLVVLLGLYPLDRLFGFLPLAVLSPHYEIYQVAALSAAVFFYYGILGLAIAFVARRTEGIEKSVLLVLGISLVTLLVSFFLLIPWGGVNLFSESEWISSLEHLGRQMILLEKKSGLPLEDIELHEKYLPSFIQATVRLLPSLWVNFTLMVVGLNIFFFRRWMPREGLFRGWKEFSLWTLPEGTIWSAIALGTVYFANFYLFRVQAISFLLLNLLFVAAAVYFFQGASILSFYLQKRFDVLMRLFVFLFIMVFFQFVAILCVLFGLFDFWFDFRRLKRIHAP